MRPFGIIDHTRNPGVPMGRAVLVDPNGYFVGTDNGFPAMGKPALFPEPQAVALACALNIVFISMGKERVKELMTDPDDLPAEFWSLFDTIEQQTDDAALQPAAANEPEMK